MHKNQKPKNKFPLTPEILKEIKETIKTLGVWQRKNAKGELMWEPVNVFKGTKDFNVGGKGQKSYTKLFERGKKPLMVNHEVNMIDIWRKDGRKGLDTYTNYFLSLKKPVEIKEESVVVTNQEDAAITN